MSDKAFRKLNIFLSIFCLAITLLSLVSFDKLMNKSYVISPDKYPTLANTDRDHDGGTAASLYQSNNGIELQCDFKRTYSKPFCEVEFVISKEGKGLDLSTYDSVTINMDYKGQENPRFRFYIRNYDEGYSVKGDAMSNKFNRLDFSLPDASHIDLGYFNVPFWWIDHYNRPVSDSAVDITNAVSVELGLGASTLAGHHTLNISSIVFHGKIISKALLGELLVGLWVIYAVYYVCCALHIARRNKRRLAQQQRHLTQEIEELKVKATTDPLTGCRNRTEALDTFYDFEWLAQQGKMIHVALFDLDHFKQINDQYGHEVGDKVLIQFVTTANETLGEHYLLYRWGGEEFLLVCLEQTTLQCHESIDNLYLAMDTKVWPNALTVTASTGITQLKQNESIRSAIKRADKALYEAKNNGRNQVVTF
ncbi:Diguanylate cyclase [Vibrio chagasii]|uniref:GGDEF domain-containing protein n=1 Tax=Vibrio sp. 99K-1 TaxID=2607603 RepID=UPI00149355D1|nr:GGDEF domain-containing protein [Vibrio sp. 99K-1]CAH6893452.1 Diguanylate cyclase [Vibrio chagasii]NOI85638.1 GGDEF domain-containing protein [Vibrio sp. 99K-1]CAH7025764.1 Diguanylate cyclase [Vibrio chagasii]CAH7126289.1 Diguanylate cyclase [Vibrio chagasii]CAH7170184.1 Diguanylate cyclase [Vibrio chagasii]